MIVDAYDDYLDEKHPACRGGCGQLADECMCNWKPRKRVTIGVHTTMLEGVDTVPDDDLDSDPDAGWTSDHWM